MYSTLCAFSWAIFALFRRWGDHFLERAFCPFIGFIGLSGARSFLEAFRLLRIVGLWLWFVSHSPTI